MKFIADLHIHSHYSLATSKLLTPVYLDYWGKIKGINVIGTGDFTHPKWTAELKDSLVEAEEGLYKLKDSLVMDNPVANPGEVRFILSAEISNIYKKGDKVRKIHNVVLAPDFETVEKIQKLLQNKKFNITSDGRPILGLDSRDLLEMLLVVNENIVFIPAHIWTPWFAALGSKSGFDSIEEAYGDMAQYIYAVETGLSSDQPLNWLCSFLDKYTLLSNSDAHSPEKLGRNANIFDTELSYSAIVEAMKNQESTSFAGTIDMYPQEGKYHYDGHRKCGVKFDPVQTLEHKGVCPVCGKPLTLGVAHRIAQLADRGDPNLRPVKKDFKYVIPLKEILSELHSVSSTSKKIDKLYHKIISQTGNELYTLLEADLDNIRKAGGELLGEAINRLRNNNVYIEEGFDGQYGVIKVFAPGELESYGNDSLFIVNSKVEEKPKRPLLNFDVEKFVRLKKEVTLVKEEATKRKKEKSELTAEQRQAVEYDKGHVLVLAGPGTGKTKTLTEEITYLLKNNITEDKITAVTFTKQAATEMQERLKNILHTDTLPEISTFHALGYKIITGKWGKDIKIINENDKRFILEQIGVPKKQLASVSGKISKVKNYLTDEIPEEIRDIFEKYSNYTERFSLLDFDDLIYKAVDIMRKDDFSSSIKWLLIDEFQDINPAQYEFMKLYAADALIFAIGDPNQSIYGFRGSDNKLVDKFKEEYKPKIITLTKSYRSSEKILKAAADILDVPESLSGVSKGIKITISGQQSGRSEAEFIARQIEDMIGGLRFFSIDSSVSGGHGLKDIKSLSDFAVLTRTKAQFDDIIEAFHNHSIPYQVTGDLPFYFYEPYAKLIDLLKYLENKNDSFIAEKIKAYKFVLDNIDIDNLSIEAKIETLWTKIIGNEPDENIEKLMQMSRKYPTVDEFIRSLDISNVQDDYNPDAESVRLMTMHAAKGLEFTCVFIAGLEDGIMPYTLYRDDADIDEERRLLYVAMTRSKKYLFLTYAKSRKFMNRNLSFPRSRFLDKIEKELLQEKKQSYKRKPKDDQLKLF